MEEIANVYAYLGLLIRVMQQGEYWPVRECGKLENLMAFLKTLDEGEAKFFLESGMNFGREIAKQRMDHLAQVIDSGSCGKRNRMLYRKTLAAIALFDDFFAEIPSNEKVAAMEELTFGKTSYISGKSCAHRIEGRIIDALTEKLMDQACANVESTIDPQPQWKPKSGIPYRDISEKYRKTYISPINLKFDSPRLHKNLFNKIMSFLEGGHRKPYQISYKFDADTLGSLYGFLRYAHGAIAKSHADAGHATAVYLLLCLKRCTDKGMQNSISDPDLKAELDNVVANAHAIIQHTRYLISPQTAESLTACYDELGMS